MILKHDGLDTRLTDISNWLLQLEDNDPINHLSTLYNDVNNDIDDADADDVMDSSRSPQQSYDIIDVGTDIMVENGIDKIVFGLDNVLGETETTKEECLELSSMLVDHFKIAKRKGTVYWPKCVR